MEQNNNNKVKLFKLFLHHKYKYFLLLSSTEDREF